MSDTTMEETPKKPSKKPLVLGASVAVLAAVGGYFAAANGMIPGINKSSAAADEPETEGHPIPGPEEIGYGPDNVYFVRLPPIHITLSEGRHDLLRLTAAIEVPRGEEEFVQALEPRILDAVNGYLRALEPDDIERKASLIEIRADLAHRVKLVVGPERVLSLLILEFVLS